MRTAATASVGVQEKRRERRYPTNDPAEVRAFPFNADATPANIVDVSRSGMKLELVAPLVRDARIEILMPFTKLTVLGEVRYCRKIGAVYHAGILIHDIVVPKPDVKHLHDDDLSLYVAGKGLSAAEVLRVEAHLSCCAACKQRLVEITRTLYPLDGCRVKQEHRR